MSANRSVIATATPTAKNYSQARTPTASLVGSQNNSATLVAVAKTRDFQHQFIIPKMEVSFNGRGRRHSVPHEQQRRLSSYVDRILKGESVGNLPAQSPDKFDLVVNIKTAKALGLPLRDTFLQ